MTVPISASLLPRVAEASVDLINSQGATAPCIGIGPVGGPAADYCGKLFEENGFLRVADAGVTGLTLGSGEQDGLVTAVASGSASEKAGLMVGDVLVDVGEHPVRSNPGAIAAQRLFGKRTEKTKVHIRRDGAEMDFVLQRSPVAAEAAPASTNPLVAIKPLVDWRGKFIPCVAIGPLGFAAISFCNSHFRPFGYVPVPDAGDAGLKMDLTRTDAAVVETIDARSKAIGLVRAGDEILAVDGAAVVSNKSAEATGALFGRIGEQKRVTVSRGGKSVVATILLTARPKS